MLTARANSLLCASLRARQSRRRNPRVTNVAAPPVTTSRPLRRSVTARALLPVRVRHRPRRRHRRPPLLPPPLLSRPLLPRPLLPPPAPRRPPRSVSFRTPKNSLHHRARRWLSQTLRRSL